jgi:hypothetical protein
MSLTLWLDTEFRLFPVHSEQSLGHNVKKLTVAAFFCLAEIALGQEGPGAGMDSPGMPGMYGPYPMSREASGTSWQPESSSDAGIHRMGEVWTTMVHGFANMVYDRQGGPRGDSKTFSNSMLMLMAQRELGGGTFGLRGMFSLDPLMGKSGYPELLQTGETADGKTQLINRQHPHDMLMEMAAVYSKPFAEHSSVFVYAGLPGEPALGPPAFMHRLSGLDNPEAPISHHWLDSTHVTFGVATLGLVHDDWKFDISTFHGREPDQFRYNIESGRLDSASARVSYNPTPYWAAQVSYGHIVGPEQLEPGVNVNRTTASIVGNTPFAGAEWQTTLAWGRNMPNQGVASDAVLLESAIVLGQTHTLFARLERVGKNDLFAPGAPMAGQLFKVNKASVGGIHDFPPNGHYAMGIGALVSTYRLPAELTTAYGKDPVSGMLFIRVKLK